MMIREYTNREVARILGEEEREPVYLHPYLQIRRGEVLLEARIGREKRYIVKNLLEFAQAVHSGKRVEYGKGMAFEHVPSAFAPESRPFLDLLLEEADAYIRHYEEMRGHAGLPLPVMRAMVGQPLCRTTLRVPSEITSSAPERTMTLPAFRARDLVISRTSGRLSMVAASFGLTSTPLPLDCWPDRKRISEAFPRMTEKCTCSSRVRDASRRSWVVPAATGSRMTGFFN